MWLRSVRQTEYRSVVRYYIDGFLEALDSIRARGCMPFLFFAGLVKASGGGTIGGMPGNFTHTFEDIISLENLLEAWREFRKGKSCRNDVLEFEQHLMSNLIVLHHDLDSKRYMHGAYSAFRINDPKPREIHKASVRDRVLHRALYRILYPYFDVRFIYDSYSCIDGKGTHKALDRFRAMAYMVSKNHTRTAWVLKCDIRKFFASISHEVLMEILRKHIIDKDILRLLRTIIRSFSSVSGVGLPLGNLTSQVLANVYMDEFDQWMKHSLHARYYIRYADDFVIFSDDRKWLESIIPGIQNFLSSRLYLKLHPDKLFLKTVASGVDFLGWVHFPDHRVVRTATKRRMMSRLEKSEGSEAQLQSYLGLLGHGNTRKIRQQITDKMF